MNWEQKADKECKSRGLDIVSFDGGRVFVKDEAGEVFPIGEVKVATWIKERNDGQENNKKNKL